MKRSPISAIYPATILFLGRHASLHVAKPLQFNALNMHLLMPKFLSLPGQRQKQGQEDRAHFESGQVVSPLGEVVTSPHGKPGNLENVSRTRTDPVLACTLRTGITPSQG